MIPLQSSPFIHPLSGSTMVERGRGGGGFILMATLREDFIWGGNCSVRARFSLLSLFSRASDIKWAEKKRNLLLHLTDRDWFGQYTPTYIHFPNFISNFEITSFYCRREWWCHPSAAVLAGARGFCGAQEQGRSKNTKIPLSFRLKIIILFFSPARPAPLLCGLWGQTAGGPNTVEEGRGDALISRLWGQEVKSFFFIILREKYFIAFLVSLSTLLQ